MEFEPSFVNNSPAGLLSNLRQGVSNAVPLRGQGMCFIDIKVKSEKDNGSEEHKN
jgi:hypothetical protein